MVVGRDCKIEEKGKENVWEKLFEKNENLIGLEEDVECPSDTYSWFTSSFQTCLTSDDDAFSILWPKNIKNQRKEFFCHFSIGVRSVKIEDTEYSRRFDRNNSDKIK